MGVTKIADGFAVGYILGTRAGRDTYERIVDGTRTLANQPAAQRAQATARDTDTGVTKTAAAKPDEVTNPDVRAVAGKPKSSRKDGDNRDAASIGTAVPPPASADAQLHSGQHGSDPATPSS